MDIRLKSFLTLCEELNYRRTAEQMNLTQPAVTRQIQSLEQEYYCQLFHYRDRALIKTPAAEKLEVFARTLRANERELLLSLQKQKRRELRIGATRTIGEFVIAPYLTAHLAHADDVLSVTVGNTAELLHLLEKNKLDFLIVEGSFPKNRYDYSLFRMEPFSGICRAGHALAGRIIRPADLHGSELLLREHGSGTRAFLEGDLLQCGLDLSLFSRTTCLNNFNLLRQLLLSGDAISFAYRAVIFGDPRFDSFHVEGFTDHAEFNFVYLKNTNGKKYVEQFMNT